MPGVCASSPYSRKVCSLSCDRSISSRHRSLHSISHFMLFDPSQNLGVAQLGMQAAVDRGKSIELTASIGAA